MCCACQEQANTPFGNNMLLGKEWLYFETLPAYIRNTRQTLW